MSQIVLDDIKKHLLNHGMIFGEYCAGHSARMMLDIREALLTGGILGAVGEILWKKIKRHGPEVLIGSGYGAINIMLSIQIAAENDGYYLKTLVARETRKDRNRKRLVEGPRPPDNSKAIYVDDLINSGNTLEKTLTALKEENIIISLIGVAVVFDFWTFSGSRRLEAKGITVERLFTRHDFGDTREDSNNPKTIKNVAWRHLAHNRKWNEWNKTAPLIVGNLVYFGNDRHQVYCYDIETGDILWSYEGQDPNKDKGLGAMLVEDSGHLYISSYDGTVTKVNALTGDVTWKVHVDMFIHSTPYIDRARNQLYIGTEGGIENGRGDITCLDLTTGSRKWAHGTLQVIPAAPNLIFDMVLCGSNDKNFYALDPDTGNMIWMLENIGEVKGKPACIGNTIIFSTQTGKLYGVDRNGKQLWKRSCGTRSHHQYLPVHQQLGLVYVTNEDGMILAFNENGDQIWARRIRSAGFWNLTLRDNELMSIGIAGHLDFLDPATGIKQYSDNIGYRVRCPGDFNQNYIAINSVPKGFFVYRRNND